MKSLIASGSFIEKSVEDEMNNRHEHTHGKIKREREREMEQRVEEVVTRSRQEPAGLNSHCTGGANRRPRMEVQMGTFSGIELIFSTPSEKQSI